MRQYTINKYIRDVKVLIVPIGKYINTNIQEKQGSVFWGVGQKGPFWERDM